MTNKQFIETAVDTIINGYSECSNNLKEDWLKTGRKILKELAKELNLPEGSYDVSINRAGPAVSGDVILHSEKLYVDFSQTCLGPSFGFLWRKCNGRKDNSGGPNQWMKWEKLDNLTNIAKIMRQIL